MLTIKPVDKLYNFELFNVLQIKKIEEECIKTIRSELGKEGVASLMEYKDMECDPVIGKKVFSNSELLVIH